MGDGRALTERIIGCAIEVHRALGPGLLALLPVCKQMRLDGEYRLDLVAADAVLIEAKAIERLRAVHDAQLLTDFQVSGLRLGLILNFGSVLLKEGIRRLVL